MRAAARRRTDRAAIEVAASPEAAYAAFVDPDVLMRWLPPDAMSGHALEYDFREGGSYRIELAYEDAADASGKTTERTDVTTGRFVTLEPGARIVQTVKFESSDDSFAGEMTMTWTFTPSAHGTTVAIAAADVPPGISAADHEAGLRASLENLARHLRR